MYCCGNNLHSQLGVADSSSLSGGVQQVPSVGGVRSVACNANSTFALVGDDRILGCGGGMSTSFKSFSRFEKARNSSGDKERLVGLAASVSDLYAHSPGYLYRAPIAPTGSGNLMKFSFVSAPKGQRFVAVSAGAVFHACLTDAGTVLTGGMNTYHALGHAELIERDTVDGLQQVQFPPGAKKIVRIACGGFHVVCLAEDGAVWVWGRNDKGQTGLGGTNKCCRTPALLRVPEPIEYAACGDYFTLLVARGTRRLYAMGSNTTGQLGLMKSAKQTEQQWVWTPQRVDGLPPVHRIAAGGGYGHGHSIAITVDGIFVTGSNFHGQLGLPVPSGGATLTGSGVRYPKPQPTTEGFTPLPRTSFVPSGAGAGVLNHMALFVCCGWEHTVLWDPLSTIAVDEFFAPPPPGQFTSLCADVCELIVEYLGTGPDAGSLARTNAEWSGYVRHSTVWKGLLSRRFPGSYAALVRTVRSEDTPVCWRAEYAKTVFESKPSEPKGAAKAKGGGYVSALWRSFCAMFAKKQCRMLLIGLDAAGKTTILYKMKLGECMTTVPTIGFNVESVEYKNLKLTCWDVGGPCRMRPLWRHYYQETDAIIFVVDSADRDRIHQARDELHKTVEDPILRDTKLLVFANKQDLPSARPRDEVASTLQLEKCVQEWYIQPCCATTGQGLYEGFDWLAQAVKR